MVPVAIIDDTNGDGITDYREASGRVLSGPEFFSVFDGETGIELARADWIPRGNISDWGDSYGNRVNRNLMCIAYLDGVRPSLVIFRGTYALMKAEAWNYRDGTLTKLWSWSNENLGNDYQGQGFHSIRVGDVDNDGKDEILNGCILIDDDGITLYSTGEGHGDRFHLGDICPDRPGLETLYVHENPSVYTYAIDLRDSRTGTLLWGVAENWGDVGRGLAADIDSTHPGMECWAHTGPLFSCTGAQISDTGPRYASTFVCEFGIWWDDDLLRELNQGGRLLKWNKYTQSVDRIGTTAAAIMVADVLGDWREEIIGVSSGQIRIHIPTQVSTRRFHTFMHDPIYRLDVASWGVGYPQSAHTSFYLGDGMAEPPRPQIKVLYGDLTGDNIVDIDDICEFSKSWLATDCNNVELDWNGDCIINFYEFSLLARELFDEIQ